MTKRGSVLLVVLMFLSLVGAGLAHVSLRLGVVHLCYQIGELGREEQEIEQQRRKLLVEKSLLRSPERIEKIARDQLGMQRPDAAQIRTIRPGVSELAAAHQLSRSETRNTATPGAKAGADGK